MKLKLSYCILLLLYCSVSLLGQATFTVTKQGGANKTYESVGYQEETGYWFRDRGYNLPTRIGDWDNRFGGYVVAASVERQNKLGKTLARGKHLMIMKPIHYESRLLEKVDVALHCKRLGRRGGINQWSSISEEDKKEGHMATFLTHGVRLQDQNLPSKGENWWEANDSGFWCICKW